MYSNVEIIGIILCLSVLIPGIFIIIPFTIYLHHVIIPRVEKLNDMPPSTGQVSKLIVTAFFVTKFAPWWFMKKKEASKFERIYTIGKAELRCLHIYKYLIAYSAITLPTFIIYMQVIFDIY